MGVGGANYLMKLFRHKLHNGLAATGGALRCGILQPPVSETFHHRYSIDVSLNHLDASIYFGFADGLDETSTGIAGVEDEFMMLSSDAIIVSITLFPDPVQEALINFQPRH